METQRSGISQSPDLRHDSLQRGSVVLRLAQRPTPLLQTASEQLPSDESDSARCLLPSCCCRRCQRIRPDCRDNLPRRRVNAERVNSRWREIHFVENPSLVLALLTRKTGILFLSCRSKDRQFSTAKSLGHQSVAGRWVTLLADKAG